MSKPIALLLDGDIFAFQAAAACEFEVHFEDAVVYLMSDFQAAKRKAIERIEAIAEQLGAERLIFCHTDSENWRKDILATYKSNRKATRKPLALNELKDYLANHYESFIRPRLEADDVMGILATRKQYLPDYQKIIVSIDKDMRTIPTMVFNPDNVVVN